MFLLFILFVLVVIFSPLFFASIFFAFFSFVIPSFLHCDYLRDPLFFCAAIFFAFFSSFFRPSVRLMRVFRSFSAYLVKNRHHIEPSCFCAQYVGLQMFTAAER